MLAEQLQRKYSVFQPSRVAGLHGLYDYYPLFKQIIKRFLPSLLYQMKPEP